VFTSGSDPVESGFVKGLNRPDTNITGVVSFVRVTGAKRLGLLRELVQPAIVATLTNPRNPAGNAEVEDIRHAANTYGQRLLVLTATSESDIDVAFATLLKQQAGGLLVQSDSSFVSWREKIVALAARHAVVAMYGLREFVSVGGLMSYGVSYREVYRQLGIYTARVLKGAKPADLPVLQPTKFEFVINFKAAKVLGLTISDNLLTLADEVIE
jgi:putative ABC transport system substrate-binding protein